jgi:transposase
MIRHYDQTIAFRRPVGRHRTVVAARTTEAEGGPTSRPGPRLSDWDHLRAQDRHPVGTAPPGDGLRLRRDLLASAPRLASRRGLGPAPPGAAGSPGRGGQTRLVAGQRGQRQCAGQKGGAKTGPNPTDRGKPGTKHHLITERQGIPVAALLTGANTHDSVMFAPVLDAVPAISQPSGQRRKRPDKGHADKGYDYPRCRRALSRRHIKVRIARKGVERSDRLGRHRWVVERTIAWLHRYRRLTVRYERRAELHHAFLSLGCALICWNFLQ